MIVRFTPQAVANLREIMDFVEAESPRVAARVLSAIEGAADVLATFPEAGRRQDAEGIRKLVLRRYPYLVYYAVDRSTGEVHITSIRHASRSRSYIDR